MMVRSRTIKYKDGKNDSWYLNLGQWKTKRWLRVVGLLSSKKIDKLVELERTAGRL